MIFSLNRIGNIGIQNDSTEVVIKFGSMEKRIENFTPGG